MNDEDSKDDEDEDAAPDTTTPSLPPPPPPRALVREGSEEAEVDLYEHMQSARVAEAK